MHKSNSRIAPLNGSNASFFNSPAPEDSPAFDERPAYIPPWTEPYIIGVAGNSGSGKTSVSQKIIQELNQPWTVLLSFDNFYKPLSEEDHKKAFKNEYDFDTPSSLDLDLLYQAVCSLKEGKRTEIPIYSFKKHDRTDKITTIYGANVIIIEGIYALYDERLLSMMDLKVFVDTDLDICLSRRLTRDILYRGRDLAGAMKQWEKFVKPNAIRFVDSTILNADLVIPNGLDNSVAIEIMIKHIKKQLMLKSTKHLQRLKNLGISTEFNLEDYSNVHILPANNHTRSINSIILSQYTGRNDFIFYFNRIAILIIENAVETLDSYVEKKIGTATNYTYNGVKSSADLISVSIIRSGDCFMDALKKTFSEISMGKLLIQSDSVTGEPQLHMQSLPRHFNGRKILLFDAQLISGAAAIMAIQVLLDQRAKQEDIIFCTYLCTEIGLRRLLKVFPRVTIVIGKLSTIEGNEASYNIECFKDTDWQFRNRFIDNFYFGT